MTTQGGGWAAHAQKNAMPQHQHQAGEREEDEITPAELAARPFFYPALTLDMLNKNRLQVGDVTDRMGGIQLKCEE